jgi:flagellar basal body-associated protein FliL
MSKKKLLIILAVVLVVGGVGAKMFVLPKKAAAKEKIEGTLYVLPKQFTLNMADGKYATLTLALDLAPGQSTGATADGTTTNPDGFGTLVEEPVVRAIVTNVLTNQPSRALITASGRAKMRTTILKDIRRQTDVKIRTLYFTDVAVQ